MGKPHRRRGAGEAEAVQVDNLDTPERTRRAGAGARGDSKEIGIGRGRNVPELWLQRGQKGLTVGDDKRIFLLSQRESLLTSLLSFFILR